MNKQLKKELGQLKQQGAKLKQKNAALKEQLEAINQKPTQPVETTRTKKGASNLSQLQQQAVVDKVANLFEMQLVEKLTSLGGLQNML